MEELGLGVVRVGICKNEVRDMEGRSISQSIMMLLV